MIVKVQVGDTVRETTLDALLAHPAMERDPKQGVTQQIMAMFEAALGDEWSKVQVHVMNVCEAMEWGYIK